MSRSRAQMAVARKLLKKRVGRLEPVDLSEWDHPESITRCFRNNRYTVMINDCAPMTDGVEAVRAMVQRHDDKPIRNHWRELQSIKNEVFGPETTAIEFYPPAGELKDVANIYWLWVLPEGILPKAVL